jgi:peptide/nickel transport system ATP-binding protein
MAMIFQEPMTSLNPMMTIGKQISETLRMHTGMSRLEARKETIGLLEKVRMPNPADRCDLHPHKLSGGQRQRVMIAMALATRPKLLIADEPTTALDVTVQGQILDLIKELQDDSGMSVLFITHDMGVVAEVADRTLVMLRGDQVELGTTTDIFAQSTHPYTRALLSAVPHLGSMAGTTTPATFEVTDVDSGVTDAERMIPEPDRNASNLDVDNLTTRFAVRGGLFSGVTGAVHAVEDVSFELYPGETLSLVGESGSGKSTVARSILRLTEPESGKITLCGTRFDNVAKAKLTNARRQIQMIYQDPFASLNPRVRIGTSIVEPFVEGAMGSLDMATDKAAHLLDRVGLSRDLMDRFPHEFSGGQRQRICIARALMMDPDIIVADEAVSALDVTIKAQVCNLLMELQETLGISYLFISHDMAVVERVSHRVAVLFMGEIVEIGPRESVFSNPQHPYTKKLMAAVPIPDPTRRDLRRRQELTELHSPFRPAGFIPEKRNWIEIAPGHRVMKGA